MPFPEAFDGSFGRVHFGEAPVEPRRRRRLVRLADQILTHPHGTLPDKIPDPHQLDAAYRLFKADEVGHAAALATHARLTHRRVAEHQGRRPRRPRRHAAGLLPSGRLRRVGPHRQRQRQGLRLP